MRRSLPCQTIGRQPVAFALPRELPSVETKESKLAVAGIIEHRDCAAPPIGEGANWPRSVETAFGSGLSGPRNARDSGVDGRSVPFTPSELSGMPSQSSPAPICREPDRKSV